MVHRLLLKSTFRAFAIAFSSLGCLLVGLKNAIIPLGYREAIAGITLNPAVE